MNKFTKSPIVYNENNQRCRLTVTYEIHSETLRTSSFTAEKSLKERKIARYRYVRIKKLVISVASIILLFCRKFLEKMSKKGLWKIKINSKIKVLFLLLLCKECCETYPKSNEIV